MIDQQLELEATANVIVPASASILGPREAQDHSSGAASRLVMTLQ